MYKIFKKMYSILLWLITVAIVVLAFLLVGVRLFGLTPYTILSGSMEPTYPVGSLIYIQSVEPEDVVVGDAITFSLETNTNVATHRVVIIDEENELFTTKGDANEYEDVPTSFDSLVGRPVFCIPKLGYLSSWVTRPPGLYFAIAFVVVFVLLIYLPEIVDKLCKEEKDE